MEAHGKVCEGFNFASEKERSTSGLAKVVVLELDDRNSLKAFTMEM